MYANRDRTMENSVLKIRKSNLQAILHSKFKGNTKSLAAAIGLSYSSTSKYLSETDTGRDIHSSVAREIEEKLGLPQHYLDAHKHGLQNIYYIMLKVTGNHVTDVVKMMLEYTEIQECSAVLGDFDIFAKVEVVIYPIKTGHLKKRVFGKNLPQSLPDFGSHWQSVIAPGCSQLRCIQTQSVAWLPVF